MWREGSITAGEIAKILKANIGSVLECQGQQEILNLENRLRELNKARNNLVGLIASGGCDEDKLDSEFAKIFNEEQSINERLKELKQKAKISADTQNKISMLVSIVSTMSQMKSSIDGLDLYSTGVNVMK